MTDDHDTEPLVQWQTYYGSRGQKSLELGGESLYTQLREAFYAGYRARPAEPITPGRDVLSARKDILRRYSPPQPGFDIKDGEQVRFLPSPDASADYAVHGTITGRFPRRDPDKAAAFAEAYGAKLPEPVAGPDMATMERIHRELSQKGVVEYPKPRPEVPASDTNPGFPAVTRTDTALMPPVEDKPVGLEHVDTVWDGEMTLHFGAPGPVPTLYDGTDEHPENTEYFNG